MMKAPSIIARSWIGTPYHHQQDKKHIGCDCLGLLRGIWREYYGVDNPTVIPNYSIFWAERTTREPLLEVMKQEFITGEAVEADCVLLFRLHPRIAIKHCAIYTAENTLIHSYSDHGVREDNYSPWQQKLAGIFKWPPLHSLH